MRFWPPGEGERGRGTAKCLTRLFTPGKRGSADFGIHDEYVQLAGDPMRHAWCNMNSSKGLQVEPNVEPVFQAGATELDDRFLKFQATRDIQAFEGELLWAYDWAYDQYAAEELPRTRGGGRG